MEQPIRMKNNGQINIVFNGEKRKAIQKDVPIKELYERNLSEQHVALKEIEDGTRKISWNG